MAKRKLAESTETTDPPRRSTRLRKEDGPPPSASSVESSVPKTTGRNTERNEKPGREQKKPRTAQKVAKLPPPTPAPASTPDASGKQYWLLKAEPETRLENGVDVRFSIDDLASRTEPEPWDGIRNYAARNNLRAMKKGDLAFFYHSNCKEPGIVGTMEIVQEHSPDLSAQDPRAPYYDPSSKASDPKWSVVHVAFRSKFQRPILLRELREMGTPGQPLDQMQLLKQSRLSVSKVRAEEWAHLMSVAETAAP